MTPHEVAEWRKKHDITIEGQGCPNPILNFSQTPFAEAAKKLLTELYPEPTSIQSQGWPLALSGKDMIGSAATGSGKTLAFALPALTHIDAQPPIDRSRRDGPIALVLVPTRELAQQIFTECKKFAPIYNIRMSCLYGGDGKLHQARSLYNLPHMIIATPGRLIDFLEEGATNLERITYLVIDEADRMFDMGFEKQLRMIINQIRPDRQVLLWSATWPRKIANLASDILVKPIRVNVGSMELSANPNVTQKIVVIEKFNRIKHLVNLLKTETSKTLIFVNTKVTCDILGTHLARALPENIQFAVIHGNKTQIQRNNILEDFRSGVLQIVIATDVASRGIDVKDIKRVINYEFPTNIENYIHRIGRTARAGKKGEAVSYFTEDDFGLTKELVEILTEAKQEIPPELNKIVSRTQTNRMSPNRRYGGY